MTIGIAAICDLKLDKLPSILYCSDRQITSDTKFDSGTPKVKTLTENCSVMYSSNDVLLSIDIINIVKKRLKGKQVWKIREIAEIFSEECKGSQSRVLERDVISKYQLMIEKLKIDPNTLSREVKRDMDFYPHPPFDFLLFGLDDEERHAHLYKIDQNGKTESWDAMGFMAIGSGQSLAISEMTKYLYSPHVDVSYAIPRIYFSKKVSERASGVGEYTDFGIIHFVKDEKSGQFIVKNDPLSIYDDFMKDLDDTFQNIKTSEQDQIFKIKEKLDKLFNSSSAGTKE